MSDCSNWRGDRIKPPWNGSSERETEWRLGRTSCQRAVGTNAESDRGDEREVDVSGWRRVRTCVSLSALNKNPESSRANPVRFLPSYELCYSYFVAVGTNCWFVWPEENWSPDWAWFLPRVFFSILSPMEIWFLAAVLVLSWGHFTFPLGAWAPDVLLRPLIFLKMDHSLHK